MASQYSQHAEEKIYPEKVSLQWKKVPLYAIATLKKITNRTNRQLLSVYLNLGVIPFKDVSEKRTNATSDDLSKYQAVDPGDFVLNNQQAWRGSVGVSKFSGIVSPAYIVLSISDEIEANFANYLFRNNTMVDQYLICSKGVGSIQRNLYWPYLKRVLINIPSKIEQNRIARFLDFKCAQINKFIQKKKRLIELLKEQKQVIINQAVTRGLDPNVRFKPSGVEWLGDIPEHWEVRKIGQLCNLNPSKSEATSFLNKDGMVRFLAMENITTEGDLINPPLKRVSEVDSGFTYFKNGDVVIAKITPCFENGKGALIANLDSICGFGTTELIVLRPFRAIQGSFLYWITRSSTFRSIGEKFMVGAAGQKRVPSSFIKGYSIAVPPADEQNNITNHIQTITNNINNCIERITREIHLIQEYRTRLISDVVTGQIDIRNIEFSDIPENELIEEALEEEQEEEFLELVGAGDDD